MKVPSVSALLEAAAPAAVAEGSELITAAYEFAERAHMGQYRLSGATQLEHALAVARILADMGQDAATLCAALLHDVVEDTDVTLDEVRGGFGDEVAFLVEGVTKIPEGTYRSQRAAQAENLRRMLVSVAQDVRVILIKLADRLHNMRTVSSLPPERRQRLAEETLDVYAPLAHRLGMGRLRWELEDLSFKELHPSAYRDLAAEVQERREERESTVRQLARGLEQDLRGAGLDVRVLSRPKHLYSIYRKMRERGRALDEIHDLLGIRVITRGIADCYRALGIVHTRWPPMPGRFKDYIALPKSNMYRSLHTTVMAPGGQRLEIQVRSEEMDRTAQEGIAAHWHYKEMAPGERGKRRYLAWLGRVLDWQRDMSDPKEFMRHLRLELSPQEVFVFTPEGEVVRLPRGATALDFAFQIHSEVGLHCSGALVDGRMAPLSAELSTGQRIRVLTSPRAHPSHDWLRKVRTGRARGKIRGYLRALHRDELVAQGRTALLKALRDAHVPGEVDDLAKRLAETWGHGDVEELCCAIGDGRVRPGGLIQKLRSQPAFKPETPTRVVSGGITWEGMASVAVRHAGCCRPIPGDAIVGLVTRGRGMSIHRSDCANVRLAQVEWRPPEGERFRVTLSLEAKDRRGLLSDLTASLGERGADIGAVSVSTHKGTAGGTIAVLVRDREHLDQIIEALQAVPGVLLVRRRTP
jgi:guanosine-3',5'-bis(diphosphate) 3'-pyrophosphohydrolase